MLDIPATTIPFLAAYAETHFRFFPLFPSVLYKREPEIVFDLPRRLNPGQDLPISLLTNDIHRFPIEPDIVSVTISERSHKPLLFKFNDLQQFEIDHPLKKQLRAFVMTISREKLPEGEFFVNATVTYRKGRSVKTVLNDNFFASSKLPFTCYNSSNPLPCSDLCIYGDLHMHSMYSQSHVEFGPPLRVIDLMASASGLSFAGITDHSYDLACSISDYLKQDQSLTRWKSLSEDFKERFITTMLQGEEITCLNSRNQAVHLGALGLREYIPGAIDGGRRKSRELFKQLTISQAVDEVHRQGGICFAAHPGARSGLLQQIFLHRGIWSIKDCETDLDAFQAYNSGYYGSWDRGKELWIKMLQSGRRIPLLAGNDAHGDFNRYRAIAAPFLRIYENSERFMGCGKTGLYTTESSEASIINCIRNGKTFVSTGPYISINYSSLPGSHAISSRNIDSSTRELYVHAVSNPEFGQLIEIKVLACSAGSTSERVIFSRSCQPGTYEFNESFSVQDSYKPGYIRTEVTSKGNPLHRQAFSSPCFLQ